MGSSDNKSSKPRVNVADLKLKSQIESTYLVKHIQVNEARDGKSYLNVILADSTGDLESRMWNNAHQVADIVSKGDYVQVSGKVNPYQGRKQFIISRITKIDASEVDTSEFLASAARSSDEMFNELLSIVSELKDVYIKELLQNILNDSEIQRRLKTWQAGKSIHHAYQGGLLEHILSCCQLGVFLSKQYQVNSSYVMAGCILHDLCKIYELTDGVNVEYTEEGRLVGHLVKGVELVDRFAYKIKNFPYQMKLHLKHILLSHHGEYEFGSPKIPQTKEAMLVHMIDLMDSRMGIFDDIIKKDNSNGHWSGYIKHLDRMIYKEPLPTFTSKQSSNESKPKKNGELKQSLGNLLKDFSVGESSQDED